MNMHDYLDRKRRGILAGSNRFFLPEGLTADNVLAAFQFKGQSSEAFALQDLSGHGFHLTKGSQKEQFVDRYHTPSWAYGSGFSFDSVTYGGAGYLDNASLNAQAIRSVIVRYADLADSEYGFLVSAGGDNGRCQVRATTTVWLNDGGDSRVVTYAGPGFVWYDDHWRSTSTFYQSAVVGANIGTSNQIYINGTGHNNTDRNAATGKGSSTDWRTFGSTRSGGLGTKTAGLKIIAAAFYNVALSAAQHAEVAAAMALI